MRRWQLDILIDELEPLRAAEMINGMVVSLAPSMEREGRMRMLRLLERLAGIDSDPEPIEVVEHDPAKAAEWLAAQGWITEPVKSA